MMQQNEIIIQQEGTDQKPISKVQKNSTNKYQHSQQFQTNQENTNTEVKQHKQHEEIKQMPKSIEKQQNGDRLKKQYYGFFKNFISNAEKYVPKMPGDEEFKRHKIKYLDGNQFHQMLQSYHQPYIRVKNTHQQGTIVIYTVIIAVFQLEITLLNIKQNANKQKNKIGSGAFGSVRIESQNKRMFAVKRQIFTNKYHVKEFNMMANKYEINEAIKQLAIYKICSLLKIGPAAETDIGFDLICYRNCIEFQIQYCIKIEYNSVNDQKNGIYVDKSKFEKQIKQCLLTLHFYRIIHKDIKPANILFSIKYNKYVFTDFGISHPVIEKIGYRSKTLLQGTSSYMSKQMKKIAQGQTGYVDLYRNDLHSLSVVFHKKMTNYNVQQQKIAQFDQKQLNQNIKYDYEYLKLKYYCIKFASKMEEVQNYWKCMDINRLKQLIGIVDKSIEYNKIKNVYNYLSKQQKFKDLNLDSLRIQSQSIKSLKIEPNIKQNTQLQLKNILRVYGYSIQVKEMIIKLKLEQIYKQTLKTIDRVLDKHNEKYDLRDWMFGDYRNYLKKIKKQLQKFQQQKNNEEVFKRYMIILQYGNRTEQLEMIENLRKFQYRRTKQQEIIQIIRVIKIQKDKQRIQKFIWQMDNENEIEKILIELRLYRHVAELYGIIGIYDRALTYYTRSLSMDIQFHGQQHPNIAITYNGIASVYDKMGKYETALTYYTKSLNMDIAFHGQQHPTIATTYNNIALVYDSMGKYETALTYYTKSLNMVISFYGQQHSATATIYNNISIVYDKMGKYETALTYYNKSLDIEILFHGQQHPNIASKYNNIAHVYDSIGKYETALTYYTKSVNMNILFHGQQHPTIATTYNNIASVYDKMGKYETALTYYTKSVNMNIQFHGQQHPNIAITYNGIASVYDKMGKYERALTYYTRSLNMDISFHGQQHPNIAITYNNIAHVHDQMGKYERALTYYTKSLNMDISFHGQQHSNIATTYNNIAAIYYKIYEFETALTYYTKSLNILISFHGVQHLNIATIYNNIAMNYYSLGKLKSAQKYFYKSISISFNLLMTTTFPLIANNFQVLSNTFMKNYRYSKSLYYAYFALDTFLKFNPLDHPHSPIYISLLAQIYYQMNRFIQSYFFYRLSCQILVRYFPIHHTNVGNAKQMMNEMEWSMPQSIHNYTSNIEFINDINSKYSQLSKHKLIKILFAKKCQLRFQFQHRSRRISIEYLKCEIEIYLCYKYLGYLREQSKLGKSMKFELQRIQQSQQKSMFREFIQEISLEC